jgi:thiol:disulfide interchange protein DsbA
MNRWLCCVVRKFHRFAAAGADLLRRSLASRIGGIFALVTLAWVAVAPHAAAQSAGLDIEGRYEVLQPPQQTETGDRIEVVDVFWYGCPHCYTFLPMMEAYDLVKPDYVEIRRMPAIFRESWMAHARAFYAAALLGVVDSTHRPLFEEIHEQRNPTDHKEALAAFFERQGVDRGTFEQTYDSFAVESLVRKSVLMQQRYGITGTPSVVVNGKYRVTGRLAGSYDNVIPVVMALVEKEREAQRGSSD